jgi:hypothetical protein
LKIRRERSAPKRRINHQYGGLVKIAARISGRSKNTVYAVLAQRITSKPVEEAIEQARAEMRRARKRAA